MLLRFVFLAALVSTLGSLYFSDVLGYPPCVLCWYQRICIYPLVVIAGVGLWSEDPGVWRYILALGCVGLVIAVYHNLLYYDVIHEGIVPCQKGVSCTTRQVEWFGFVTIPLLSLVGFLFVNILSLLAMRGRDGSRG